MNISGDRAVACPYLRLSRLVRERGGGGQGTNLESLPSLGVTDNGLKPCLEDSLVEGGGDRKDLWASEQLLISFS